MGNPSNLESLLKTNTAEKLAAVKTAAPTGWERGNERIGDKGFGSTGAMEPGETAEEKHLLERAGFNPADWSIVGDVQYREWDANIGGGVIKTMQYRRFAVRKKVRTEHGFEDLLSSIKRRRYKPVGQTGRGTFWLAQGDWQLGKVDGDGTEGIVNRIVQSIDNAAAEFRVQRKRGKPFAHLAFMGDCMEGFVSQGGKNAWRTELTLTEQLRLTRRLMLYTIDQFAPLTERLTVVSVPGNHDEAVREPGLTRYDDSFAVDSLVAVQDAMEMNKPSYGHVETFVPRRDELTVTMDVNGTVATHAHGHQWRVGKHFEWWQGSAFEPGSEMAKSTLLLAAHGHTLKIDTKGSRRYVQSQSQESESTWWRHRTGDVGAPGALTFFTEDGYSGGFTAV